MEVFRFRTIIDWSLGFRNTSNLILPIFCISFIYFTQTVSYLKQKLTKIAPITKSTNPPRGPPIMNVTFTFFTLNVPKTGK